ncbi:MAG: hypothetical protein K1X92_16365 [Bacteroidia bacterium]|nr:hypothetical protein [Bacteroidia bacterium]
MKKLFWVFTVMLLMTGCAKDVLSPAPTAQRGSLLQTMRSSPNLTELDATGHSFGANGVWEYSDAYLFEDNTNGRKYELYIFDDDNTLRQAGGECDMTYVINDKGEFVECTPEGTSCRADTELPGWYWVCD